MTAENYHLKWDSHLSYLNSSVATLYKNEKYADVILYSSNTTGSITSSMPTVGISAHKFILSSCSQFFSAIFETSPVANNGVFNIVLPPDLSHRAIQILVQYMYVGEATVSNDILSEVLRGGEILKIRGLCRTSTNTSNTANQQPQQSRNIDSQQTNSSSYNLTRMPMNSGPTSVRYLMEQQQQQHSRGLGASVMPKDSPVIIKSPKPLSTLASSTAGAISKPTSSGITINKQVAIDPGDKCCYSQESLPSNNPSAGEAPASICNEIGCNSCPRIADNLQPMILRRERSQSDDPTVLCRKSCLEGCDDTNYLRNASSNECGDEVEEERTSSLYEHEMRGCSLPTERSDVIQEYVADNYSNRITHIAHSKHSIIRENVAGKLAAGGASGAGEEASLVSPNNQSHEPTTAFVSIKEEPTDWLPSSSSSLTQQNNVESSSKVINKIENFQTTHIKMESSPSSSIQQMENDCRPLLAPSSSVLQPPIANDFERYLSCDICNKTCEDKATLVRHLETHTATPCSSGFNTSMSGETSTLSKAYVPKKRRRISQQENTTDHVCLQCDLCSTRFETPAEWVRHMNSQHTEVELAMFNSKKDKEKHNSGSSNKNHNKKPNSIRQPHQQQQPHHHHPRTQVLNGSTNSNLSNNTSVLCTSPNQPRNEASSDYLRFTLSPA